MGKDYYFVLLHLFLEFSVIKRGFFYGMHIFLPLQRNFREVSKKKFSPWKSKNRGSIAPCIIRVEEGGVDGQQCQPASQQLPPPPLPPV